MTSSSPTLAKPVGKITGCPSRTSATVASGVLSSSSSSSLRDVLCISLSLLIRVEGCCVIGPFSVGGVRSASGGCSCLLSDMGWLNDWWQHEVVDGYKGPLLLSFVAFVVTFLTTRSITRLIRDGKGPFHNVSSGGVHMHHSTPGIVLLIVGGFTAVGSPPLSVWTYLAAVLVGVGASLVLDEFAMIFRLQDVYWSQEGQLSVNVVTLAAACVGLATVGVSPANVNDLPDDIAAGAQRGGRPAAGQLRARRDHGAQGQVPDRVARPVRLPRRVGGGGAAGATDVAMGAKALQREEARPRATARRRLRQTVGSHPAPLGRPHRRNPDAGRGFRQGLTASLGNGRRVWHDDGEQIRHARQARGLHDAAPEPVHRSTPGNARVAVAPRRRSARNRG